MRVDFKTGTFYLGDCFEVMADLAPGSVDMVLNDPPYGTVAGIASGTDISHGMKGRTEWDVAFSPIDIFKAYNRVLRPNAAAVIFSQEPYTSKLIGDAHGSIPFSYRLVWEKDHFANALIAKKAPVSYFEDAAVFFKNFDSFLGHPLKAWFDSELEASGLSRQEAVQKWGSTASHYFTDGRQFSIPSEEKLSLMQMDTGRFEATHADLKTINDDFRASTRERFPKIFNLWDGAKFKSNILKYKKDADGFHPTQKPVALFEDLVRTYTNPDELVLDNTAGSGTTAIAALQSGRRWICIERDEDYFAKAIARVWDAEAAL